MSPTLKVPVTLFVPRSILASVPSPELAAQAAPAPTATATGPTPVVTVASTRQSLLLVGGGLEQA